MALELTKYPISTLTSINSVLSKFSSTEETLSKNQNTFVSRSNIKQFLQSSQYTNRVWSLYAFFLTVAEKEAFKAFWEARNGKIEPFKWLDDGVSPTLYYVRFGDSALKFSKIALDKWRVDFTLEECNPLELINDSSSGGSV